MSVTAKPVRVVLLDRTPVIDAPERIMLAALAGCALTAAVLLGAGWRLSHC